MSERVSIYISATKQHTTAKWHLVGIEGVGNLDAWVAILDDIQDLKPFQGFSKVAIRFKDEIKEAEFYYGGFDKWNLIQRDSNKLDFWIKKTEKEMEENNMVHNVTITKSENKVLEEYWVLKGIRNLTPPTNDLHVTRECKKEPTLEDIAQFLCDANTKSVTVEHNYRFGPDLPFC